MKTPDSMRDHARKLRVKALEHINDDQTVLGLAETVEAAFLNGTAEICERLDMLIAQGPHED